MVRSVGLLLMVIGCSLAGAASAQAPAASVTGGAVVCANGSASAFPCGNVDLSAYLTTGDLAGVYINDIWGWTDPETGKEYALVGRSDGLAFVDVTDPVNPVFIGTLPTHNGATSVWRDMKVYADYVFVVADRAISHGMQVFDLAQLRGMTGPPVTFSETAHYAGISSAHNLAINEETGFAYIVGANGPGETCGGGLHMVNIQDPLRPSFAGCFADPFTGRSGTGYSHDAQCVVYHGPDEAYRDREICFGSNETVLSIADVTDKNNPVALSRGFYPAVGYAHQGWLTEDHRYFLLDDELDERNFPEAIKRTRTLIWDIADLDDPILLKQYFGVASSIDHNQYVVGDYVFQANYTSGLRILDISDINNPQEVAFFDTVPGTDEQSYSGAWSVYPFFKSGTVVVSSIHEGLFVLKPTNLRVVTATEAAEVPASFTLSAGYPNPFNPRTTMTLTLADAQRVQVAAYDLLGRVVALLHDGPLAAGAHTLTFDAAGLPSGSYLIKAAGPTATQTRIVTLAK